MAIFLDFSVLVLSFAISGFAQSTPQESFERELNSAEERFKVAGKALSVQVRVSSEEELELVDMLQGMYPFACPVHPNSITFEIGGLRQNLRHYGLADAQIDQAVKRFLEMLGLPLKVKQARGTSPAAFPFASYALKYKLLRVTERGVGEAGQRGGRSFLRLHVVYFHRYPKLSDTSNDDWGSLYLKPEGPDALTPMILPRQSTFRYPTDAG